MHQCEDIKAAQTVGLWYVLIASPQCIFTFCISTTSTPFVATHLTFQDTLARNQKYLKNAVAELLAKVTRALIGSGYEDAGRAADVLSDFERLSGQLQASKRSIC